MTNEHPMHILMADDDKDDYYFLKEAAERTGQPLKVSYAANWLEVWKFIIKTLPYFVFIYMNMPVKNGLECLQLLREDRKYDDVSIIIYSTSVSKNDIDKAYEHGANYFVVKPNAIDDITNMVKKIYSMGKDTLRATPPREEFVII
jgi:CheY-like chemotaxis protein